MKFLTLLFFTVSFVSYDGHCLTFSGEIQDFRYEYLNQKGAQLKQLDRSFFEVYNRVKIQLDQVANHYLRFNSTWNGAFSKVNVSGLERRTLNHLRDLHSNINHIVSVSKKNVNTLMGSFYVGLIGVETEPLAAANKLWEMTENHMNSIGKFYETRVGRQCTNSLLKAFHPIYLRGILMLTTAGAMTHGNISAKFSKIVSNADTQSKILRQMATDLEACSSGKNSNLDACVKKFVAAHDGTDKKLFEPIGDCAERIDDVKNFYEKAISEAKEQLSAIDDDLLEWSQNIQDCIDAGGPPNNATSDNRVQVGRRTKIETADKTTKRVKATAKPAVTTRPATARPTTTIRSTTTTRRPTTRPATITKKPASRTTRPAPPTRKPAPTTRKPALFTTTPRRTTTLASKTTTPKPRRG